MQQQEQPDLLTFSEPKQTGTPAAINVLTILTFIGCGIQFIMAFLTKWIMGFALKIMDDPNRWEQLSTKEKDNLSQAKEAMVLFEQYFIPLTIITLVGIALCFVGAMQMRKLKKQGFYLYVAGEFMPIIASAVLIGISVQINSPVSAAFSLLVPVLFTVLYSRQLKYMK